MGIFSRLLGVILSSWTIWTVYRLGFGWNGSLTIATGIFIMLATAIALIGKRKPKEEQVPRSSAFAVIGWMAFIFIAFQMFFWLGKKLIRYLLVEQWVIWDVLASELPVEFGNNIPGLIALLAIVSVLMLISVLCIFLLICAHESLRYSKYAWKQMPILSLVILQSRGRALLIVWQLGLLFLWGAVIIKQFLPLYGEGITFFLFLATVHWVQKTTKATAQTTAKLPSEKIRFIVPFVIVCVLALPFILFLQTYFYLGVVIALVFVILFYLLLKLRLFPILKWVLLALSLFAFSYLLLFTTLA